MLFTIFTVLFLPTILCDSVSMSISGSHSMMYSSNSMSASLKESMSKSASIWGKSTTSYDVMPSSSKSMHSDSKMMTPSLDNTVTMSTKPTTSSTENAMSSSSKMGVKDTTSITPSSSTAGLVIPTSFVLKYVDKCKEVCCHDENSLNMFYNKTLSCEEMKVSEELCTYAKLNFNVTKTFGCSECSCNGSSGSKLVITVFTIVLSLMISLTSN